MKNINSYILEKLDYSVKTPDLNDIAYDSSGDKWVIDAFCYADGGAPTGCNSLESMLRDYDAGGTMKEWLKDNKNRDAILVAVHREDDEDEQMVEIWGRSGICYENEPK